VVINYDRKTQHMAKRIDSLTPGSVVKLKFHAGYGGALEFETDTFLRVEGEGDQRQAFFQTIADGQPKGAEWSARRYDGRWVYGDNAQVISLVEVLSS
jgi:hypothetical protein